MAAAPFSFQIHAIVGMAVFMIWPITRLVHAFSAPLGYLFRPYVVYRDRGPHDPGSRATHRGWEKFGWEPTGMPAGSWATVIVTRCGPAQPTGRWLC